jgi:hypothetical protein
MLILALSIAFLIEAIAIVILSRRLHSLETRTYEAFKAQNEINKISTAIEKAAVNKLI